MGLTTQIINRIREYYPWLLPEHNGVNYESGMKHAERRLAAVEEHMRNLEDRYADLENRLLDHAQGQKHKRMPRKPEEG